MASGVANLEFGRSTSHVDTSLQHLGTRCMGNKLRGAQAGAIDPSGDAGSDLSDCHDEALRARRPDGLGRRRWNFAIESHHDTHLDDPRGPFAFLS